jgi:hypothetical protein
MADMMTDLVIYIGIGFMTFVIGLISGYLVLSHIYTRRFLVIAQQCSDAGSAVPIVDELARET